MVAITGAIMHQLPLVRPLELLLVLQPVQARQPVLQREQVPRRDLHQVVLLLGPMVQHVLPLSLPTVLPVVVEQRARQLSHHIIAIDHQVATMVRGEAEDTVADPQEEVMAAELPGEEVAQEEEGEEEEDNGFIRIRECLLFLWQIRSAHFTNTDIVSIPFFK
jgi:hypothetical protein